MLFKSIERSLSLSRGAFPAIVTLFLKLTLRVAPGFPMVATSVSADREKQTDLEPSAWRLRRSVGRLGLVRSKKTISEKTAAATSEELARHQSAPSKGDPPQSSDRIGE